MLYIIGYEKDDFKTVEVIKDFLYDVEFKWIGVWDKEVIIEPNEYRDFDGLCLYKHSIEKKDNVQTYKLTGFLEINQRRVDNDKHTS